MVSFYKAVLAFARAVLSIFCEIEFVLRAQTRFHAFPINVSTKMREIPSILCGDAINWFYRQLALWKTVKNWWYSIETNLVSVVFIANEWCLCLMKRGFSLRQSGIFHFCEIEFVQVPQTRFHAFPINVSSKMNKIPSILYGDVIRWFYSSLALWKTVKNWWYRIETYLV